MIRAAGDVHREGVSGPDWSLPLPNRWADFLVLEGVVAVDVRGLVEVRRRVGMTLQAASQTRQ